MKDIKSFLIGFLSCACLFLFMGQSNPISDTGRYQTEILPLGDRGDGLYYTFDTREGKIIKFGDIWRYNAKKKDEVTTVLMSYYNTEISEMEAIE
tara:strand:- start:150 stop:434 length:285 start_codon:yes stop_codon:yes gene_type:complete